MDEAPEDSLRVVNMTIKLPSLKCRVKYMNVLQLLEDTLGIRLLNRGRSGGHHFPMWRARAEPELGVDARLRPTSQLTTWWHIGTPGGPG